MKSSFLTACVLAGLLMGSATASAQRLGAPTASQSANIGQLALASTTEPNSEKATAAVRVACSKLKGLVMGLDGQPLIGATVTVKGTEHLYITDSEGKYLVEVPVYQGQVLEVEAAGYTTREVSLSDCNVLPISLEPAEGTRIKKKGKRAGQIVRFGTADMQ